MKTSLHPIYHQIARVELSWSNDKDQAYQRARAVVNQLVVSGFINDGFWSGDDYCVKSDKRAAV